MDRAQRIEAVRSRFRDLKIDELSADATGEPCTRCIHFLPKEGRGYDAKPDRCRHLVNTTRKFDPIRRRYDETAHVSALDARSDTGLCGPEGVLFDPGKKKGPVGKAMEYVAYAYLTGLAGLIGYSLIFT